MPPAAARLLFLSLQASEFSTLRELVLTRPLSSSGLKKYLARLDTALDKHVKEVQMLKSRGRFESGTYRVSYKRDVLKDEWKASVGNVELPKGALAPVPGERVTWNGYDYWALGERDDGGELVLVRGLQMLADAWAAPTVAAKGPAQTLFDDFRRAVGEAQRQLSLPACLPDATDWHVLDDLCAALCAHAQTKHKAEAGLGVETLVLDGAELPIRRLRRSELIDLSRTGLYTYQPAPGGGNAAATGFPGWAGATPEETVRIPLRALSVYVIAKILAHANKVRVCRRMRKMTPLRDAGTGAAHL